ncbi:MAG: UPF0182 family protein [Nanoarchaeota archaeon]|nr:UPF0182 family protein [Nanoarchaeota archaeon]
MQKRKYSINSIIVVLIIVSMFWKQIVSFVVDYMWFDAIGYKQLFIIPLKAKILLFAVFFIASLMIFIINSRIALHKNKTLFSKLYIPVGLLSSFFIGLIASSGWSLYLKYLNGFSFNLLDPLFGNDISYYVFVLPFLSYVINLLFLILIVNAVWLVLVYLWKEISQLFSSPIRPMHNTTNNTIDLTSFKSTFKKKNNFAISLTAKNHLFIVACLFFLLTAVRHYFLRFEILFSQAGVVYGAGFSDVNVSLPIANILVAISVLIAVVIAVALVVMIFTKSKKVRRHHILIGLVGIYFIFIVSSILIPGFVQTFKVNPNEFSLEEQYIKNNIKYTNIAYGLDEVEESFFDVADEPKISVLEENQEELQKLRILDWRPLKQTYKQLQEIRLYYDFYDVDIGKYNIDGVETQVMLSARELDHKQLGDKAKTWINQHMVFTHGYGVVMSPVNKISKEGFPEFLIKDIPPVSEKFEITRPEIYYGEIANEFVIVNTDIDEFDYPKGDLNEYTNYQGKGGVVIDSFFKKLFIAMYFGDINIILNSAITDNSRILFNRQIQDRIRKVVPFLTLDSDPYVAVVGGRLKWIQDAYTITDKFPYSEPTSYFNYIVNSVKIVIDAYDGSLTFYLSDPEDPIIQSYSKIFPGLLKSMDEASPELKSHFRYPEDLFKVQVNVFSTYHMTDPKVYYNREDLWDIPNEIFGQGNLQVMTPYYILLKLPNAQKTQKEEYVLITPYTPVNKDNMIAWISGKISFENGKINNDLILFKFPKDKLVLGPSQIEARIDQNSEISEQLTLWSQRGSNVIRGNLLVIPIENTLLYIEPLYISADNGEIPELKRILLSYGNKIVMEKDFEAALNSLFEGRDILVEEIDSNNNEETKSALEYYNKVLESMENKDWEGIGKYMELLEEALNKLDKE